MDYPRSITADPPYGEAVPKAALQAQGSFGTLTEIDVQATAQDVGSRGAAASRPGCPRPVVGYVTASDNREERVGLYPPSPRPAWPRASPAPRACRARRQAWAHPLGPP